MYEILIIFAESHRNPFETSSEWLALLEPALQTENYHLIYVRFASERGTLES